MNFRKFRQAFAVPVNAEITVGTSQGGDQAGFATDGVSVKLAILTFQTAAVILGSAMVGADAFGDFGRGGVAFLNAAHKSAQQGQNKELGDEIQISVCDPTQKLTEGEFSLCGEYSVKSISDELSAEAVGGKTVIKANFENLAGYPLRVTLIKK